MCIVQLIDQISKVDQVHVDLYKEIENKNPVEIIKKHKTCEI